MTNERFVVFPIPEDPANEARGRNGWYKPVSAEVCQLSPESPIDFSLSSKRPSEWPAIFIRLTPEAWKPIITQLQAAVNAAEKEQEQHA